MNKCFSMARLSTYIFFLLILTIGCGPKNDDERDSEYFNSYLLVHSNYKNGQFSSAEEMANKLLHKFPNKLEVYLALIDIKNSRYDLTGTKKLSEAQVEQKSEVIRIIEKGFNLYQGLLSNNKVELFEKIDYRVIPLILALNLYELSEFERSVDIFEQYYDINNVKETEFKYVFIQYADALAREGRIGEGNHLYLQAFDENKKDLGIVQEYIQFFADHGGHGRAIDFAQDYIAKKGMSDRIQYKLCQVYEQTSQMINAKNCFVKLIHFSKQNKVFPEYIEYANNFIEK